MTRKRAEKRDTRFCVLRVKCLSQNLTFSLGFHLRLSADSAGGKKISRNPTPVHLVFFVGFDLAEDHRVF